MTVLGHVVEQAFGFDEKTERRGAWLRDRCCCESCFRKAVLRRANERRRVRRAERACVVCGEMFVPTQSTAKTCSNRCRQALFRQSHR